MRVLPFGSIFLLGALAIGVPTAAHAITVTLKHSYPSPVDGSNQEEYDEARAWLIDLVTMECEQRLAGQLVGFPEVSLSGATMRIIQQCRFD